MNPIDQLNNLTIRKMNTVEINKSIMELNYRKEKLQREVDDIQSQINFLANLRESQRPIDERSGQSLFDQMFGVK
jgi:hypothetical protein